MEAPLCYICDSLKFHNNVIDNNKIVAALGTVLDPQSGRDLIAARMVEGLKIDGNNIFFSIKTNNVSPEIRSKLNFDCMQAIAAIYPEAQVHIHVEQENKTATGSSQAVPQIKNIIAVASGKGGVGKSTVAVNLALGLKKEGLKVGILDADLYGPSIPIMLGLTNKKPKIRELYGQAKIVPLEAFGIPMISIGNIIDSEQAVVLRGPRLSGVIKQFINDCLWPELDVLVIDLPPGTGDIQLTMVQTVSVTGAVIVCTPQFVATADAVKAINMFRLENINVPILGVVENMSWFIPPDMPDKRYTIFGEGGGKKLAEKANSVLLGQIPIVEEVRSGGDNGQPIVLEEGNVVADAFVEVSKNCLKQMNLRNETMGKTPVVQVKRQ